MAHHHRKFQSHLDDAEKLRLYAQSAASHQQTLNASLDKVESSVEHWEKEARDGAARVIRAKQERYKAMQEAKAAWLVATSTGDAKARVEVDLTKALNSFAATEEDRRRSEAVITRLEAELTRVEAKRASLLLELEASKGEVSSFHVRARK